MHRNKFFFVILLTGAMMTIVLRMSTLQAEFYSYSLFALAIVGMLPLIAKKTLQMCKLERDMVESKPGDHRGPQSLSTRQAALCAPEDAESTRLAQVLLDACSECKACITKCPFLAKYGTPASIARKILTKKSMVDPFACSLCGLCGAVCPQNLSPDALFLALRRQAVTDGTVDLSRYKALLNYEKRGTTRLFSWYSPADSKTVFFPGCTLSGTRPETTWSFYAELRTLIPDLGIVLDCCHKPSHDLGRQGYFLEHFGAIRQKLIERGVTEVLVACPNCFKVFDRYGGPLKVSTVYEVMARHAAPPAVETSQVVIHDPCPLRHHLAIQDSVRILLAAQGVATRKMKNSGKMTLCCGEGGGVGFHEPMLAMAWTKKRMETVKGDLIITYCAGCAGFLGQFGKASHLGEVMFEREKALSGACKPAKAPWTYYHRLRLKRRFQQAYKSFKNCSDSK